MTDRPEIVTDEHLVYLDDLRESGVTNMFGAGSYVKGVFEVNEKDAGIIVSYWMDTFGDRHPD